MAGSRASDELRELEDESIRAAIALQEDVGLQVVTDGEYRRRSWLHDFVMALNGTKIAYVDPDEGKGTGSLPF